LHSGSFPAARLDCADLTGADLCHGHFNQANFSAANLTEARLEHADLSGVIGRRANLRGANLRFANLTGADLQSADLTGADLLHAKLQGADLTGADLSQAQLNYADLAKAKLKDANLAGASLRHAKNLTSKQLETAKGSASTSLPRLLAGTVSWSAKGKSPAGESLASEPPSVMSSASKPSTSEPPLSKSWATAARTGLYPALRSFNQRASWVAGAALWTLVVIGFAMKESSEAVPLLTSVMPPEQPALTLVAAEAPDLARALDHTLSSSGAMSAAMETNFVAGVEAETASTTPPRLLLAALSEPRDALRPDPTPLDEAPHTLPLPISTSDIETLRPRTAPDFTAEEAGPDMDPSLAPEIVEAVPVAPGTARPASLKQTKLRQVTKIARLRVREIPGETPAPAKSPIAEGTTEAPMLLVVSLRNQKIDVYRGTEHVTTSKVSTGMPGYETRTGVFSILEKRRHHHSNIYSNAPMPWMQRLTWSGTALHAGVLPGYPASHGCIRLPFSFAPKLFKITEDGINVVVANDKVAPAIVDHPNLPRPVSAESADAERPLGVNNAAPLRILVTRRTEKDRLVDLQYLLSSLGYLTPQKFTGKYGNETKAAIRSFQKAKSMPETGAVTDELVAAVYNAAGKEEPPPGHLFVRQDYNRLFDAPITFRHPGQTLGTHLFTAMNPTPGTAGTKWLAISLEGGDAASALDRIEIPEDLRWKIAEALTPGSTLIIGDRSIDSSILREGDDFIVLTKEAALVASIPKAVPKRVARKRTVVRQARRTVRRVTREARPFFGGRNFPQGLFSRW
jgi:lipoprotein-anchoring transpeptidase ErfK/SrfK